MTETTRETIIPSSELTDEQKKELTRTDAEAAVRAQNRFAYGICITMAAEYLQTFRRDDVDNLRRNLEVEAAQLIAEAKTKALSLGQKFNDRAVRRKYDDRRDKVIEDKVNEFDSLRKNLTREASRYLNHNDEETMFMVAALTQKGMALIDEMFFSKDSGRLVMFARLFNAGMFDKAIDEFLKAEGLVPSTENDGVVNAMHENRDFNEKLEATTAKILDKHGDQIKS